jgi:uncharacterized protein
MVIMEEAQEFAPQLVRPDHAKMVGAIEKLVKLGRNFGVGTAMISQRPQAVNKDILNQAEVLFAFQLTGPQERKAIDGWVQEHGADRAIAGDLPSLPVGTALVWSPQWLKVFGRYAILPKWTYDASATPGAEAMRSGSLADVDLEAVRREMVATIERAKAEDPAELRRQLAAVTRERDEWKVEAKRATAELAQHGTDGWVTEAAAREERDAALAELRRDVGMLTDALARIQHIATANTPDADHLLPRVGVESVTGVEVERPRRIPTPRTVVAKEPAAPVEGKPLGRAERAILTALAQYPGGRTKTQVGLLTGYSSNGGGFNNAVSALRSRGYIEGGKDLLVITAAGLNSGVEWEPLPGGAALMAHWQGRLGKCERLILDALLEGGPRRGDGLRGGRRRLRERTEPVADTRTDHAGCRHRAAPGFHGGVELMAVGMARELFVGCPRAAILRFPSGEREICADLVAYMRGPGYERLARMVAS